MSIKFNKWPLHTTYYLYRNLYLININIIMINYMYMQSYFALIKKVEFDI